MHSWNKLIVSTIVLFCCVQYGSSIKCYNCNSNDNEACADPFDESSTALIPVECGHLFPTENSTFCRKTVHKVALKELYDERVIRTCGFVEERRFDAAEEDDDDNEGNKGEYRCYLKPGTFGVETRYCACEEDGCNGVENLSTHWSIVAVVSISAIVLKNIFS